MINKKWQLAFVLLAFIFAGCSTTKPAEQNRNAVSNNNSGTAPSGSFENSARTTGGQDKRISDMSDENILNPVNYRIIFGKSEASLIDAVQSMDTTKVDSLLKSKSVNIEDSDDLGNNPLMYAVYTGNISMITMLLQQFSANPNKANNYGQTPLLCAAAESSLPAAGILVRHGANVNAADNSGNVTLGIAVYKGDVPMVEQLLGSVGINPNIRLRDNNSILMQACYDNNFNMARIILEKARSINILARNDFNKTALDIARENGNDMLIRLIESKQ